MSDIFNENFRHVLYVVIYKISKICRYRNLHNDCSSKIGHNISEHLVVEGWIEHLYILLRQRRSERNRVGDPFDFSTDPGTRAQTFIHLSWYMYTLWEVINKITTDDSYYWHLDNYMFISIFGRTRCKNSRSNLLPKKRIRLVKNRWIPCPERNTVLSLVIHYLNYLDMTQHFCLTNNSWVIPRSIF